ncbi:hypothetical protein ACVINW_000091 [Bradyrhizobium sp. USDA 4461]
MNEIKLVNEGLSKENTVAARAAASRKMPKF